MNEKSEFGVFDKAVRGLLKVSHETIKTKLEEEKTAKKRKKSKVSSVSRVEA